MKLDVLGLLLSGSCLAHCLLLPVALVAAPSLAAWLGGTETAVHWALFAVALVISGWALYAGYRHHGNAQVVALGGAGLVVLAVAAAHVFGRAPEALLSIAGAAVLGAAHVLNLRKCASPA